MAEQEQEEGPEPDPGLRGLRRAIKSALLRHPKVLTTSAGVRCAGRECDWEMPADRTKSTTQRFANHQTFEIQKAVTEWYYREGRSDEAVSRETLPVL